LDVGCAAVERYADVLRSRSIEREFNMPNQNSADVIIVGTGVIGCLISEQMLDAGLSVLMLEAGPRVERWQIVENFRNLPPSQHLDFNAPFPPNAQAAEYLQLEGPNARAYRQDYVRYAGGSTWHWAGICWRLTPQDMRLKSLYGVGRDWVFAYDTLV
jgi:fructose 5-dehydrogenase large subunit